MDTAPILVCDITIMVPDYVQYDIIIGRIHMVPVPVPIGGTHMYLNIPGPHKSVDPDPCIEKIRTRMIIGFPRPEHFNLFTTGGSQVVVIKQPVFPYKMQKLFTCHHRCRVLYVRTWIDVSGEGPIVVRRMKSASAFV